MAEKKEEAEDADKDISHLLRSVEGLQETLKDGIKKNSKADGETDTSILLSRTGPATINSYVAAFRSLHVTTKSAFEGVFQKFFRYPEVQESFDNLLELENAWDQSLVICEANAGYSRSESVVPTIGSLGPINIQLVNARTEKSQSLSDYLQESCNIILVLLRFLW